MVRVNIVVRKLGRLKPEYSLDFELPEGPSEPQPPTRGDLRYL